MLKVLVIGGTTFDSIITLKELPKPVAQTIHQAPFHETIGSTGAGKALNLTKLAIPTTLHSIIGNDSFGEKIRKGLNENGVDFIYDHDPKGTERHVNLMSEDGKRISIFLTQSSSDLHLNMKKIERLIMDADVIVLNIIAYTKKVIPLLKKHQKQVWTDLHDYDAGNPYHQEYIDIANSLFLSSENLPDYRTMMQKWIEDGKELVVCTHGKAGATVLTKDGKWQETPILEEYSLLDANGAGDSFFSGYLYGYLNGKTVDECMRLGTICAGLCISSKELAYPQLNAQLLEKEYVRHYG